MIRFVLAILLIFFGMEASADEVKGINYKVNFDGVADKDILTTLQSVSQLVSLKTNPPATMPALRKRAEADIPNLVQGLRSYGYYNAKVELKIDANSDPVNVHFNIDTGPVYPLRHYRVLPISSDDEDDDNDDEAFPNITPESVGITIGDPAIPKNIIDSEKAVLRTLIKKGYTLAVIENRDVVADQETKSISVTIYVTLGPKGYFGDVTITGQTKVEESFIRQKICWDTGDVYDPRVVEETQLALEATGLFSSVVIMHHEEVDAEGLLPMDILLIENKHRTLSAGLSYSTQEGPGVTAGWEHRNLRGMGEKLNYSTHISQKLQLARLVYGKPDFWILGQDLLWIAQVERETTKGFTDLYCSFSGILERRLTPTVKFSYGGTLKQLKTEDSDNNRHFTLLKSPLQLKWSAANNLLDPTKGGSVNLRVIPTAQVISPRDAYVIQNLIGTIYRPITEDRSLIIAAKVNLGSVWGSTRHALPPSERFYAGNESILRGYNYETVSPLDDNNKPLGGRSIMVYTIEPRWRINETFGLVAFYEVGNVYGSILPKFNHKQLQSTGVGFRYHTPVGPLRLDVAFPLNKRYGVDRSFQFYISIGQAF